MSKLTTFAIAAVAALTFTAGVGLSAGQATRPRLVRTIMDENLGEVVTTANRQAIYVWRSERRGTIRCTGSCARAWPPVLVRKGVTVRMHYPGVSGDFGTIRRPDGSRQLTLDRRALYTYAHEKPGQVLCNDVDNWFAVKAKGSR
jgi:predicted lipoprotein with Yx(FWY)xxD motif